jgi:hypothetical protein
MKHSLKHKPCVKIIVVYSLFLPLLSSTDLKHIAITAFELLMQSRNNMIKAGDIWWDNGTKMMVVKPNNKIPGDWFCRPFDDTIKVGLWSFDPRYIIANKE